MADLAPAAPVTKAANRIRAGLAANSDFQAWCDAADLAEALTHIPLGVLTESDVDALVWPYVEILSGDEGETHTQVAVQTFTCAYTLKLFVGNTVPTEYKNDARNAWVYVENDVDTMTGILRAINGIEDPSGSNTLIEYNTITLAERPAFLARAEGSTTDRYQKFEYVLELTFGPGPAVD